MQIDPQAVIFMTAYADTDKAVRAIKADAIDFIPKPWEKGEIAGYSHLRYASAPISTGGKHLKKSK